MNNNNFKILIIIILTIFLKKINCKKFYNNCNCENKDYCKPLDIEEKQEFIGFSINSTENYLNYNYYSVSTIAVSIDNIVLPEQFVCISHSFHVRLVWHAKINNEKLTNKTYVFNYLNEIIDKIQKENMDGVIYQLEDPFKLLTNEESQWFTFIVQETYNILKEINSNYKISVKLPYSPISYYHNASSSEFNDLYSYDYIGLDDATDYLILMDYFIDGNMQVVDNQENDNSYCIAVANSPNKFVVQGVSNFKKIGISESKLILTYAWFGIDYTCLNNNGSLTTTECIISFNSSLCNTSTFNSSNTIVNNIEKLSKIIGYGEILKLLNNNSIDSSSLNWDENSNSMYFNYIDKTGHLHQVWFDSPKTLLDKVWLTKSLKVKGIGAFNMDFLNFKDELNSNYMYDTMEIIFA